MNDFWSKQLNVPIRETRESQVLHLTVKTLLALAIKIKYAKFLRYQNIFSEFEIKNNLNEVNITDVYHENKKDKTIVCYEVQKIISDDYIKSKNNFYKSYSQYNFNSVDWILINLNFAPSDINKLWEWIKNQVM